MVNILHISDLHFPDENLVANETEFIESISVLLDSIEDDKFYILISGDITYQGNEQGYIDATRVFKEIFNRCKRKIKGEHLILCPGNHDIVNNKNHSPFELFDDFSSKLRRDNKLTFSRRNHQILETEEAFFLVINSCYKLDHKYGFVNTAEIRDTLLSNVDRIRNTKLKIAIVHHHIINQFENDTSVIRNAYEFISLLDHYGFKVLLHGHQHNNMYLPIGKSKMLTFGVGSPGFKNPGYTNGISYYRITQEATILRPYTYSKDNKLGDRIGGFMGMEEEKYESV